MCPNGLPQESLQKIEDLIEELKEANLSVPVLVEGKRDLAALRELGLEGEILLVNSGKNLVDLSDLIAKRYSEIIILTDWDRKGSYLAGKMFTLLRDNGVLCNMEYRRKIGFYAGSLISTVEELPSVLCD